MFSPVTPCIPNRLNNHPPTTAPTIPRAMSRKNPSPVLLTSLLPMKPAIRPSTTHEMIDMIDLLSVWHRSMSLLDDLIRASQQRRRDGEAEDRRAWLRARSLRHRPPLVGKNIRAKR